MTTNQKTFNKVVRFLYKQKEQSVDTDGSFCMYRGENGRRCAAGCLIPNKLYNKEMEGTGCEYEKNEVYKVLVKLGYEPDFVRKLQLVHDGSNPPEWHSGFQSVAYEYGLTWPKDVPTTCWIEDKK